MIKICNTILILIVTFSLNPVQATPMSFKDIVIVEISAKDLGLKIRSESEYYRSLKYRTLFRQANIDFLREAIPRARFILIDMWYPDLLNNDTDKGLLEILRSSKNITMSGIGKFRNKTELAHPLFRSAVTEVGHIFMYDDDPKVFQVLPVLCGAPQLYFDQVEQCPENSKLRHVSIIAAEGYLSQRLKHANKGTYNIPREYFSEFLRISLTEFQADPAYIEDKLVILINKPLPHMDVHKTIKGKTLTGSEILAELILLFANNLPTE